MDNYIKSKLITTSVYDHKYLSKDLEKENKHIFEYVKSYTVSSKKLLKIYENIDYLKDPEYEITDGVDLELFKPKNISRLSYENLKNRTLNIGWVGNSKWSGDKNEDVKGFISIIKPAVEGLIKDGYNINLVTSDKNDKFIPHDKMPEYYNKIDLYICASLNEGTPNPVLEAMACGVPVISTDVGIVPEVFGKTQKEFILKERNIKSLKEKIIYLLNNLNMLEILSKENLESIKDWTWENKVKEFDKFFTKCLKEK